MAFGESRSRNCSRAATRVVDLRRGDYPIGTLGMGRSWRYAKPFAFAVMRRLPCTTGNGPK